MNRDVIATTCRACGCAGFAVPPGCKACGFGSEHVEEPSIAVPSPRNADERSAQIQKIVAYAIETRNAVGAVRALDAARLTPGSELAKLLGAA